MQLSNNELPKCVQKRTTFETNCRDEAKSAPLIELPLSDVIGAQMITHITHAKCAANSFQPRPQRSSTCAYVGLGNLDTFIGRFSRLFLDYFQVKFILI
jgi:hypothetical protein